MATDRGFEFRNGKDDCPAGEYGFFAWEIATNLLYADAAVAGMFGLDWQETGNGLALEAYLARIHPEDRPDAAKIIHDTIVTLAPEHQSYRVRQASGTFINVVVLGRCFSDRSGVPSLYAGIIFPVCSEPARKSALLSHCLAAYDIAVKEKNQTVIDHLLAVITSLDTEDEGSAKLPN